MDRREALRRTALLMGGIVSAPSILAVMQGCARRPRLDWKPAFLSEEQAGIVTTIAEIIIPRTETPGAKDAGVPAFIDTILAEVYDEADRTRFMEGLAAFADECARTHGRPFLELRAETQVAFTKSIHDAAVARERSGEVSWKQRPFVLTMKELTLLGFFTSEPGATQVLQYQPVPGVYLPCVPLAEAGNGRTWAM